MRTTAICIGLILLYGCATPGYIPKPMEFKYHVRGMSLETTRIYDGMIVDVIGEIIEVSDTTITLLSHASYRLVVMPKSEITEADIIVATSSDNPRAIKAWAGSINLLSALHGYFFPISLTINLATTIPIALNTGRAWYRVRYPLDVRWEDLYKFARFPQGMPEDVSLGTSP